MRRLVYRANIEYERAGWFIVIPDMSELSVYRANIGYEIAGWFVVIADMRELSVYRDIGHQRAERFFELSDI